MVGALGYFVDIYDLVVFLVVRLKSLKELGVTGDGAISLGAWLISCQMFGLLIGGVLGGLIGDRFGRRSLLFGSILLYSSANLANAFVHDMTSYEVCRFFAGLGLAGELGGSVTLVSELLPRNIRGYGTSLLTAFGILGAVCAGEVGRFCEWRVAYVIGGTLGLCLLFLRFSVPESSLFKKLESPRFATQLGILLSSPLRMWRYVSCILIGLPCWYVIGILVAYSPEIAKELGCAVVIESPISVIFCHLGISLGDIVSGICCQIWQSRKIVIITLFSGSFALSSTLLSLHGLTGFQFYLMIFLTGFAGGYWAIFATVAAEHFGTNIRATVATTVPNFCRGALAPLLLLYTNLKPAWGCAHSSMIIGLITGILAFIGWFGLRETFHDELDYEEK